MELFIGLVLGALLLGLIVFIRYRKIAVKWYEWLLGALGLILLVWGAHDVSASFAEYNAYAARTFLYMLGIPALALLSIAAFLPWWRSRNTKR